jgi:nicotinate-nucleotide adenylyltransferase
MNQRTLSETVYSIGVMGGTYNPFHDGHARLAESLREEEHFDKILFVPAYDPPHKNGEEIVEFDKRIHMVEAGTRGNPDFWVSRIEATLPGKSYSFNTIQALKKEYPGIQLVFILGRDSWDTLNTWYRYKEILGLCHFIFVFNSTNDMDFYWSTGPKDIYDQLTDCGMHHFKHKSGTIIKFIVIPTPKFRSTDIRWLRKQGRSCRYLVPEPVFELINKWNLYT